MRDVHKFISFLLPVTADNRVPEVNTQRLRPSQALKTLYGITPLKGKIALHGNQKKIQNDKIVIEFR
jgi:hypothetical protein